MPFEIPENWCWTTVSAISKSILYGVSESAKVSGKYRLLRITDIQNNNVQWNTVPYTDYDANKAESYLLNNGDILFARTGATVGKSYLVQGLTEKVIYASYLIRVQTYDAVLPQYVKFYFESGYYWEQIERESVGVGQPNVNGFILGNLQIPIPPIHEQNRIVLELTKCMDIIDAIEDRTIELESYIRQTKSKILDLAISGKLVPQDPDDEPAIELLKRINPGFEPCDNSHYENLPQGWSVCRLEDIFNITMGQSPAGESINGKNGIEFHQGKIHYGESYLLPSGVYTDHPTKIADVDSLLLCVRAPVGVLNITQRRICIGRGLCALKPKYVTDNLYWLYVLSTYKDYFESNATGSTFKAISGDTIKNTVIKLPPRQEQQRIFNCISSLYELLNIIVAELV